MESNGERNAIIAAIALMVIGVIWMIVYTFTHRATPAPEGTTASGTDAGVESTYDVRIVPPPEPPVVPPAPTATPSSVR